MKVYHGSIQEIRFPLAKAGRPNLDFGRGFYVTDIRRQAEEWAERIGLRMVETPVLNIYELSKHRPNNQFCLISQALIDECLHFISVEPVNLK